MDTQHPYPALPTQPTPEPPARPRRVRRTVAVAATTALVAGVAGIGAGYVAGHGFGAPSTSSASGSAQRSTTFGGSGSGPFGTQEGSADGSEAIPGNPGWTWNDGGGTSTDPYGQGSGQQGSSGDSTAKASGSQLTGLVRIVTTMKYAGAKAAGTGMVLTSDGEVVTNHHVVEGATSVKVKVMTTGKTYVARVVGTDAKDDVAVLQLTGASGLSTVRTDTDGASVGDTVTAVGDANGTESYLSAASGKVTALSQSITTQSEGTATGERLTGLMKISSDVISGDSGGATYDSDGEVVGMTTAASSGGGDVDGYAVPIAKVMSIVDDLESNVASSRYDYTRPAFMGIGLGSTGTQVAGVYPGTPAYTAGIRQGDTVTAVDGTTVRTSKALRSAIAEHSPGDSVSVTWTDSAGASHTKSLTLVEGAVE